MQWLEAKQGAKDSAFVSVTFDLENGETEKAIQFEQAFPKGSDVQVVGWIQSFRIGTDKGEDYACDFWATKVNAKGFTAHAECGGNTERLTVTFIALKNGKDKVATGTFSTEKDGEEGESAQESKGRVDFEEGVFDKAPTVLVALSQFELAGGKDLRIGVDVEDVSEDGFSWVIRKLATSRRSHKDTCTDTNTRYLGRRCRRRTSQRGSFFHCPWLLIYMVPFMQAGTALNAETALIIIESFSPHLFSEFGSYLP